jgi:hypothetical protein
VFEELPDFGKLEFTWMTFAMKQDETADPLGGALTRLRPAEAGESVVTKLFEQSRRLTHRNRRRQADCSGHEIHPGIGECHQPVNIVHIDA